jgi:hypothetical protein
VEKPNERERERSYYSASGKYISAAITQFPAKRKIPRGTKIVPKSVSISMPKKSIQLYRFALFSTLKSVPKSLLCEQQQNCPLHQQNCPLHQQKTLKWLTRNLCSKLPQFPCPPSLLYALYELYGSVHYGLSNSRKFSTHKTENPLGICAQKLLGNVPSLLSQAYSEILSQSPSLVSCTLPNAFFYKI